MNDLKTIFSSMSPSLFIFLQEHLLQIEGEWCIIEDWSFVITRGMILNKRCKHVVEKDFILLIPKSMISSYEEKILRQESTLPQVREYPTVVEYPASGKIVSCLRCDNLP